MNLAYSAQALADLDGIADYLNPRNAAAALKVAKSVRAVIDDLAIHPMRGRRQDSDDVRKVVEPKYGYLIYYHLDVRQRSITVISIRHHARTRPFDDA